MTEKKRISEMRVMGLDMTLGKAGHSQVEVKATRTV